MLCFFGTVNFRDCTLCGESLFGREALKCEGCFSVVYCGVVCQRAGWSVSHRERCLKGRKSRSQSANIWDESAWETIVGGRVDLNVRREK